MSGVASDPHYEYLRASCAAHRACGNHVAVPDCAACAAAQRAATARWGATFDPAAPDARAAGALLLALRDALAGGALAGWVAACARAGDPLPAAWACASAAARAVFAEDVLQVAHVPASLTLADLLAARAR